MANVAYSIAVSIPYGGLGTHAYADIQALNRAGLLKEFFCSEYKGKNMSAQGFVIPPISKEYPLTNKMNFDSNMATIIDYENIDIFHHWASHGFFTMLMMKEHGKKIVAEFADPPDPHLLFEEREKYGVPKFRHQEPVVWKMNEYTLKYANYIHTVSNFCKRRFLELGFPEDRILVDYEGTEYPKKIPDYPDEVTFGFLGSACLRKGTPYLIEAWHLLKDKPRLIIQGSGHQELKPFLEAQPARDPQIKYKVEFRDFAPKEDFFKDVSVEIQPSIVDGFGLGALESLAYGRPIIVSKHVGSAELMTHGKECFKVDIRNPQQISQYMQYFKDNPNEIKKMGAKGRRLARKFSWQRYENQLIDWYKNVVLEGV